MARKLKERSVRRLLVFLPPTHAGTARTPISTATVVRFVTDDGSPGGERGESPIALLPPAAAVELLFDPADVFVAAIEAPKLSEARLRQALPNLLEERLLSDPGDCHFAFNPPGRGDDTTLAASPRLPVAVIHRGVLTRALDAFNEAGIRPAAAYSALYAIPAPEAGTLAVRAERGRAVARVARHDGFAFELGDPATAEAGAPPALALAVRQLGIRRIHAYGEDAPALAALARPIGVEVNDLQRGFEPAARAAAVDLLQGAFATGGLLASLWPALAGRRLPLAALKAPAAWAAAAGLAWVLGMNAYWLKLEGAAGALRTQMEAAFRSAFPEATAVVDPVLQARRQLGVLRARAGQASADDFTPLNATAAQLFATAPVGSVSGLEYRDGVLKVRLKGAPATDPGLQNALRAQAIQQGLTLRFETDGTARLAPATP